MILKLNLYFDVPTKKPRTTIYLEPELMQALEERAKQEKRTVSNLCNLLLEQAMSEWLKQKGK
ncbi:MAG: ribbon-helix-helix protein, CopG family [Calothrix sp. CSU_2_0]|nr:ribbon-helix-helix protein, CopG family [Calothrix sp. CSU_2_0]